MPILTITGAGFFGIVAFVVCGVYTAVKVFKGMIGLLFKKTSVQAQRPPSMSAKGDYNRKRCQALEEINDICNSYSRACAQEIDAFRRMLCSVLDQYRSVDVTEDYVMTMISIRNLDLWVDLREPPEYKAISSIQY